MENTRSTNYEEINMEGILTFLQKQRDGNLGKEVKNVGKHESWMISEDKMNHLKTKKKLRNFYLNKKK